MRLGLAFLFAASINLLLFLLMSIMVSQSGSRLADSTWVQVVDFIRPKLAETPPPKHRPLPPPPPKPPSVRPLTQLKPPPLANPRAQRLAAPKMSLDLPMQIAGVPYLGDMLPEQASPQIMLAKDLTPLVTQPPLYPPTARARRLQGYVEVEFTVNRAGGVQDIEVIGSEPPGAFDRAALRAIGRWKFEPHRVGGKTVAVRARQRVDFKLK
jgi:protein TonB